MNARIQKQGQITFWQVVR
jgi:hypothetical protein